ncbi:MAG: hypothetical protein WBA16_07110 [Nonlabens sp.]
MNEKKPPLFTQKSLVIITKILAIYSLFFTVTAFIPIFKNPVSENPMMPSNHYAPVLFAAAVHFVVFVLTLWSILSKKYSWLLILPLAVIVLLSRFYYDEIAVWVWQTF